MTYGAFSPRDVASFERGRRPGTAVPQAVLCAVALILGTSVGLSMLYGRTSAPVPVATPPVMTPALPDVTPPARYSGLLDPGFAGGYTPLTLAQSAPLKSAFERPPEPVLVASNLVPPPALELKTMAPDALDPDTTEPDAEAPLAAAAPPAALPDIPLPLPRPALLVPAQADPGRASGAHPQVARLARAPEPVAPPLPQSRPSFFAKMFGRLPQPSTVLAYATPEDGNPDFGRGALTPDRWSAVYNIATHTVTLPDGTRLEAHSGLGARLDDPHGVAEHMRGATPPNVYDLEPRAQLFHGVPALRLNPVGSGTTYGRAGLLAHSYMLGPRGDSNGCVVFKDYRAFRRAYDTGLVRRLVVVAGRD